MELREAQLIPTRVIDSLIISESVYKNVVPPSLSRARSSLSLPSPLGGAGCDWLSESGQSQLREGAEVRRRLQIPSPRVLGLTGVRLGSGTSGWAFEVTWLQDPGLNL